MEIAVTTGTALLPAFVGLPRTETVGCTGDTHDGADHDELLDRGDFLAMLRDERPEVEHAPERPECEGTGTNGDCHGVDFCAAVAAGARA